jgi:hypothetical protein
MKNKKDSIELAQVREWMQRRYKTYSVEKIIALGGTDEFAHKIGHNPDKLAEILNNQPSDSSLTAEELETALRMLQETK